MNNFSFKHCCTFALAIVLQCSTPVAFSAAGNIVLGSGRLGAGAIGLFSFTLNSDVGQNDSLILSTTGSRFDTEIAVFDARGYLISTNDDMAPGNLLSELRFGMDQALPAGNYSVVLGGFNSIFRDGDIIPGSSRGGDFQLNLETELSVVTPSLAAYTAKDGNLLPAEIREIELGSGRLDAGAIQKFDFVLQDDVLGGDWLAIHITGAGFDSEIGLYDAEKKLIATNDDINPRNPLSRLSFGLDGDNGRGLLAGAYTLLVGGFNTTFTDGQTANSSSTWEGNYAVHLQTSRDTTIGNASLSPPRLTVPEPSSFYLACLGLAALFGLKRGKLRLVIPSVSSRPCKIHLSALANRKF